MSHKKIYNLVLVLWLCLKKQGPAEVSRTRDGRLRASPVRPYAFVG